MALTVVTVSPRQPAGVLSLAAWDALRAGPVYAPADSTIADAVRAAGIAVATAEPPDLAGRSGVWLASVDDPLDALPPHTLVAGSWDPPGARLLDVVAVMDRLRRECPWDGQQTHESLKPYLLEESYEVYDALTDGDLVALREELGDLLFQVAFHSRLAAEDVGWDVDDVAADLVAKLIRRHPHVFAGQTVAGADEVNANWEVIKRAEKGRQSIVAGVPSTLPALALAATLARKARRAGVPEDLMPDDGLFAAATRSDGVEDALRTVARKFRSAIAAAEAAARADGLDSSALAAEQWRRYWPVR